MWCDADLACWLANVIPSGDFQTTKKSAILTAAKKAKLKSRPSKVRFAEGVVINGSPLYSSDLPENCIPNVMKVSRADLCKLLCCPLAFVSVVAASC